MTPMVVGALSPLLFSQVREDTTVEGYCKPVSVRPGEVLSVYISAAVDYEVTYIRLTDLDLNTDENSVPLLRPNSYNARFQEAYDNAWRDGCNWEPSFSLVVPLDWHSGIYAVKCAGSDGCVTYIVFIVKPKLGKAGHFLVLANTNTWNAYNSWGGRSRYDDDRNIHRTSFDRPNPGTSPVAFCDYHSPAHLTRSEVWVLKWLCDCGYKVDVYADHDFHSGIAGLERYCGLIMNGHPEYWTTEMLDNLESYLGAGGCLLYLGGNGIFERVMYSNSGDALVYHGGDTAPNQLRDNFYFRNLDTPRPERAILGVGFLYDNYFSDPAPYEIKMDAHRFFAGTGLRNGDKIGQGGLICAASGREMDSSRRGSAAAGVVVNAWICGDDSSDRGNPPANLEILAEGTNRQWRREDGTREGPHAAQLTCYDTASGGFVLSAGSFCFGNSLVVDEDLQRIVRNALNECLNKAPIRKV